MPSLLFRSQLKQALILKAAVRPQKKHISAWAFCVSWCAKLESPWSSKTLLVTEVFFVSWYDLTLSSGGAQGGVDPDGLVPS